ncbi:MAG: nucleotide-binding protein [Luteimonas sp.]
MKTILVASSKGGVGKTTIATHLAAQAALSGKRTVLVDADPQRSSTRWAEKRAGLDSAVLPVDGTKAERGWQRELPENTQVVIVDGAAGAMAHELMPFLERADSVVVPVLPSALDIEATVPFLDTLAKLARVRRGELPIGLVGNKLRPWTNASQQALELWKQWPYPVVAQLRDSQAYSVLVGLGKSLFDYQSANVREHQEDWQPLLRWTRR